jgi:Domain of unknown function (DUF4434)
MKITGTFIDEISHDIPHQNWGAKDWDRDFAAMKSIGIDTVIIIRCGHGRFITYPSKYLTEQHGCYKPPVDLLELYLDLAEKYDMNFYLGLYDSRRYWIGGEYEKEVDINRHVAEEVWKRYGHKSAFKGWYINQEVGRFSPGIVKTYAGIGKFVKDLSGNLSTMISPFINGSKAVGVFSGKNSNPNAIKVSEHEKEWDDILAGIEGAVDIVAFQDGHCEFHELEEFLTVNKSLTDRHGMYSWTNCESFDRDMPIKFLPIKWEKMLLKLEAARAAGMDKAITFEFSHFMSPNSCYQQAHGLFNRYREYFK